MQMPANKLDDRKIVRTSTMDLEVKNAMESAEKIRALAESVGGFLVTSELGEQPAALSSITVRVPVDRLEEARKEIRQLATRIYSEKSEANDVTTDYVDREARLRNLRAQEAQYIALLKNAKTIKDTLDVSEKLDGVREDIDKQQAEFETLSRQVETVAISVTMSAESDAQVLGMHWRPWQTIKISSREGLESFGSYISTVTAAIFQLPAVLLWLATILFVLALTIRGTRWVWKEFFAQLATPADKGSQA